MDLRDRIHEAATKAPRASRKAWYAPTLDDFADGVVLCFDQTVTKTGWVLLSNRDGQLTISSGGVFLAPQIEGVKGFEGTLRRAVTMSRQIEAAVSLLGYGVDTIVHEMPAVMGWRTESSLMGAMAVRLAAQTHARGVKVAMISKQSTGPLLVSPENDRLSKANVKKAINALIPDYNRATSQWTQDVSDATALGLVHLYRRKHDV